MGNGHLEQGKIGRGGEVRRGQVGSHIGDCFSDVVPKFILQIVIFSTQVGDVQKHQVQHPPHRNMNRGRSD